MPFTEKQEIEFNKIRASLGEAIYPSKEECEKVFKRRNEKNSIYIVYNIKEDKITSSKGAQEYLGYPDDLELSLGLMSQYMPESSKRFFEAQAIAAYKVLLEFEPKDALKSGLISFTSNRVVLDKNGVEVHMYQTTEPFQFDKNGNVVSNISWYHIKDGSKNEKGFQGGEFVSPKRILQLGKLVNTNLFKSLKNLKEAKSKLVDYKIDLIDDFPLTETEQLVISKFAAISNKKLSEKNKIKKVANMLKVSPKTIQVHRDNINNKSDFFGNFSNFNRLVEFLENEKLIKF